MVMPSAAKRNMTAENHRSLERAAPEVFVDLLTGCAALLLEATAEARPSRSTISTYLSPIWMMVYAVYLGPAGFRPRPALTSRTGRSVCRKSRVTEVIVRSGQALNGMSQGDHTTGLPGGRSRAER